MKLFQGFSLLVVSSLVSLASAETAFDASRGSDSLHLGLSRRIQATSAPTDVTTSVGTDAVTTAGAAGTTVSTVAPTDSATTQAKGVLDPWVVGTHVYKQFPDGWYLGSITGWDNKTETYTITYEDGDTETLPYDSSEIDAIVTEAENYVPYDNGTPVRKVESGSVIDGTISGYQNWTYFITWTGGAQEQYTSFHDVDAMVNAAIRTGTPTYAPTNAGTTTDTQGTTPAGSAQATEAQFGNSALKNTALDNKQSNQGNKKKTTYEIVAGVCVALLVLVMLRRLRANNVKRRRQAELVADEYKDHLELPEME